MPSSRARPVDQLAALTSAGLRGKVVLVDFWTYTCINWLRTLPYVRAWAEKYKDQGLVVIGVHSPEFPFERDIDNVRRAAKQMKVDYPIAVDSDHAIWRAFHNQYWPALYLVDAKGRIRHHHFGEGEYERSEQVIQQLLAEAGARDAGGARSARSSARHRGRGRLARPEIRRELRRVRAHRELRLPRRPRSRPAARVRRPDADAAQSVGPVGRLDGAAEAPRSTRRGGRIAYRFHARDLHLVMGPPAGGAPVGFASRSTDSLRAPLTERRRRRGQGNGIGAAARIN